MRRAFIYERAVVTPAPAPAPTPTPSGPPPIVVGYDDFVSKYYLVPLKGGKNVVICMDKKPDIENVVGPFNSYIEAQNFNGS